MTIKLYDEDAYAVGFDAVVTAVEPCADGAGVGDAAGSGVAGGAFAGDADGAAGAAEAPAAVWVTLDRTLFFPEEGGQSPDRGELGGFAVTDVQIADGVIRHKVTAGADAFAEGTKVHGRIDWEYRFRNMQMHTGEHIFSGLVNRRFGYHNVGFHLSERTATMDYDGKITDAELAELELAANRAILENRAVRAWYPGAEELAASSYRSKKEIDGAVRLVEIEGVDLCACCAPHVRTTGEVGCFKLIGHENYKGGVRVSYRCGLRAMEDYEERLALLAELSHLLSAKTEDLAAAVSKLQTECRDLAYANIAKDRAIALTELASAAAADGRTRAGDGRIEGAGVLFLSQADPTLLRFATDEMKKRYAGVVCVMLPVGGAEAGGTAGDSADETAVWRYIIEQDGGDVSAWQQTLRERFGAKGGGPKNSVQGSLTAARAALALALAKLAN
ncbi:MAG: alanyl-tRNA editing protein [Lachnospiraceae bacterium]|nr:alanyl-tRNA editing protein [Lachnospiraceae bacterium]